MNFSRFFIDRPIFAGVLSTLIFVAGLLSLPALPISEYPEVAPPTVVVRAQYPGANPKVIAETVSTPIEEQINGVEGMLYMSSQATTDGLMTLNVTFRLGTDPDKAQQLVQNRVAQAEPRLPSEVVTDPGTKRQVQGQLDQIDLRDRVDSSRRDSPLMTNSFSLNLKPE